VKAVRGPHRMRKAAMVVLVSAVSAHLWAVEYECRVEKKFNSDHVYTPAEIDKGRFAVRVEESGDDAFLSRCSWSSIEGKVTCDRYEVDRTVLDEHVKIKKYYVFRSQFDVQLFPDLSFIENNGRGDIAFGRCRVTAP
jgi:hypothetical protein